MDWNRIPYPCNLRVDPWLIELARQAAADDQRSLTSLVEKLLADYLREHGYLAQAKGLRANELTSENVD
jgi:hypothetical protein